jgi:hypothetical protein
MSTSTEIKVSDAAFEYLRVQKGSLDRFATNRALWERAYHDDLAATYQGIRQYLPPRCWGMLDIGSGLGGIDILLSRHYASIGKPPYVNLLDGESDPPKMHLHRETFNDMRVAQQFLKANGISLERFAYYTPDGPAAMGLENLPKPYDLVVSFGSWCFHYAPDTYLPVLLAGGGLHTDSVVIVDVRKDKPDWLAQLQAPFELAGVIRDARKYMRMAFKKRRA